MSRTKKFGRNGWAYDRDTRFHYRQKKISGARNREFEGYDSWDSPHLSNESMKSHKIAIRLCEKGWDAERIIRHLRKKFNIGQEDARDVLPYDLTKNDDWTDKPK